jgi:hypothetical protein
MNRKFVAVGFNPQKIDRDSTDLCGFIAKTCIFLFFIASYPKLAQLLITSEAIQTNRIQREFYSNVAIRTQKSASYSRLFAKLTNLFKPFLRVLCVLRGEIPFIFCFCWNAETLSTNRIQREFLFNNRICSQNFFSRLSKCPKTTNLFKQFA